MPKKQNAMPVISIKPDCTRNTIGKQLLFNSNSRPLPPEQPMRFTQTQTCKGATFLPHTVICEERRSSLGTPFAFYDNEMQKRHLLLCILIRGKAHFPLQTESPFPIGSFGLLSQELHSEEKESGAAWILVAKMVGQFRKNA